MFLHQHRVEYLANYNQIFAVLRIGWGALDKKCDAKFDKCILVFQIKQITTQMSKLMANIGKLSGEKDITRNRSPSPLSKRASSPCFGCGEVGHFKMECSKRVNALPERKVTFAEQSQAGVTNGTLNSLNLNGATREAGSRPLLTTRVSHVPGWKNPRNL